MRTTKKSPPPRKPPVSVTDIRSAREVVTDADYQLAVDAQRTVLLAQGAERKALGRIRSALARGARDGGRKYYFDEELGIVRRRERTGVGS